MISLDPAIWQCFVVAFQKTAKNVSEYGREHTEPRRMPVFPGYDFVCWFFFCRHSLCSVRTHCAQFAFDEAVVSLSYCRFVQRKK